MKGRVLWSKVMMLMSRLPLSLSFFLHCWNFGCIGLVTMTIIFIFLQCICFPLMTNFALFRCVFCVVMYVAFFYAMLHTCGNMNRLS